MSPAVLVAGALVFMMALPLPASQPALPTADDPVLEARLNELAVDLRCVVCQNESLAESRASLALDLRAEIRGMMRNGLTDEQVLESLVARYGDFVLYRPPVKPLTYALWGGPFVFLLIGIGLAAATLHRRRSMPEPEAVSPEALRQAARLLRTDPVSPAGQAPDVPGTPRPPLQQER
ncbi:cytochrome c-type biogenesis protein [Thioalkalivibrio sp.]|uniref:cytochrome c-type biogenesis protein n=1 Tax=Thioalkalivibrio sp. TaxID=2093813 RepID=UPI0012D551AB|nr:cytochrome c-type biogenesis protein [Thioalkalivibrio sp.]TVP77022.1 MAG: cytochrome c-type biogenesis protein CcmH [Thioalkalivibrio sp.]